MAMSILKRVFGSRNERVIARMEKTVGLINKLEPAMTALNDDELQKKTLEFKSQLSSGISLEQLLPEAFAVVRETSRRVLGMRPFDVQLIGGMVLHEGRIAEMRTGEGKTLVATLPAYLNALTGRGVHIITVNDYLATRDAQWMAPVFNFLGMSVGIVVAGMNGEEKQTAYAQDIVYGTNNEFGFDYLRDNMVLNQFERVQQELHFAIIDEVDSILIDEARTPLIISGPSEESSQRYLQFDTLVPHLKLQKEAGNETEGDFLLDEKTRQVHLTEHGHEHVELLLTEAGILAAGESLYAAHNVALLHYLNAALRANHLFHRDVDYMVTQNEVVIVDEHTGRTMPGRRWSDGLHQALEAKEKVPILPENQTLASVTFQNYFRLYNKLAGMTGTADTEAYEFQQIYGLEVIVIPPNQPIRRVDYGDQIYLTKKEKFNAVIEDIQLARKRGQPILVGTTSIHTSEMLSEILTKINIPHQVLNAKFHQKEAQIIAEAGRPQTVTIATNMAGRGTDIVLGGNLNAEINLLQSQAEITAEKIEKIKTDWQKRHDEVIQAGGLHIIATERHESRRIDNQLRGRGGRQGDPGSSRFYLSLEDNLVRIFANDRIALLMRKFGMEENEPIEHKLVSKAIENAQKKVEGFNFDVRKQLLEFDNVANEQRQIIYKQRRELLDQENIEETITDISKSVFSELIDRYLPPESFAEQWDISGLMAILQQDFACDAPVTIWSEEEQFSSEWLKEQITELFHQQQLNKEALIGFEAMRQFEKTVMLQTFDMLWREHVAAMDYLRQGIGLRGYAQKNPKQEYKREAFELFSQLIERIKYQVISHLASIVIHTQEAVNEAEEARLHSGPQLASLQYLHEEMQDTSNLAQHESTSSIYDNGTQPVEESTQPNELAATVVRLEPKIGRNAECPCGSGKKYKHCHGVFA